MTISMDSCDLCGLPLRRGAVCAEINGRELRFCCYGCRQVYMMLMESADSPDPARFKETEIYRRCAEAGIIPESEADLERRVKSDAPGNPRPKAGTGDLSHTESGVTAEGALALDLKVHGMWCPACAWVIEQGLQKLPGVERAQCHFVTDRVRLFYDPVKSAPHRITEAIGKLGYRAVPAGEGGGRQSAQAFIRLGISAFLTMNVMMLSFALYSGFFTELSANAAARISWPILIMAALVYVYGGAPIHQKALAGIRMGAPGMEALITLGASAAFAYSLYNFFQGSIHLYFDTASMLITLVLIGKAVEQWTRDRVQARISSFFDLLPQKVRICSRQYPEGRFAGMDALDTGDIFRVLADESIPADGRIVSGAGRVNESALTGEARPVVKRQGDTVSSGTRL
ncbi:MAG: cation transporter, partial [Desulfobacteraceae bacterium]|nr:cation transporter [Desulfobacteraceae bacterium]